MKETFARYGIKLSDDKIEKLKYFGEIIKEYNCKINLTSVVDDREVLIKHFLDSAIGEKFFPIGANCCEVGSGGGFPSLPLKIVREDLLFTLIEATGKKCEYLKYAVKELSLDNVLVVCGRAEELGKDKNYREKFDAVTARAVAKMNVLCEYCAPFIKVNGKFIAYKGEAAEELKEAENAVKTLGLAIEGVNCFDLPDGMGKRNIIVMEKIKNTPAAYPRGNGKERKKPL